MIPYPTDAQAKADILAAGRKIYQRGLVAANDGNLSVRVGENALWVTPTGVCKGDMTEDMLVKMTLDGTVLEGTRKPSSETKMHLRIYQENPTVRAVVHAHPPVATTFAAAGIPLDKPVLQEAVVQLGTVPVAPFALPGSQGVADSVAPFCRDYRALLLEYHGAVTWGTSMEQAHYRWSAWNRWPPSPCTCTPWGATGSSPLTWWRNWRGSARRGGFYKIRPTPAVFWQGWKNEFFMNLRKR